MTWYTFALLIAVQMLSFFVTEPNSTLLLYVRIGLFVAIDAFFLYMLFGRQKK